MKVTHLNLVKPEPDETALDVLECARHFVADHPGSEVLVAVLSPSGGLATFFREGSKPSGVIGLAEMAKLQLASMCNMGTE